MGTLLTTALTAAGIGSPFIFPLTAALLGWIDRKGTAMTTKTIKLTTTAPAIKQTISLKRGAATLTLGMAAAAQAA